MSRSGLDHFCSTSGKSKVALGENQNERENLQKPSRMGREHRVLIVDDDEMVVDLLSTAFQERIDSGVLTASSVSTAVSQIISLPPTHAVLDMKLRDGTGLDVLAFLRKNCHDVRAVVLTGYGSLSAAVASVKRGAIDYLQKPVAPEFVVSLLFPELPFASRVGAMPPEQVRWEHIRWALDLYGRNVTETARHIGIGRRTLQRIIARHRESDPPSASAEDVSKRVEISAVAKR